MIGDGWMVSRWLAGGRTGGRDTPSDLFISSHLISSAELLGVQECIHCVLLSDH